MRVKVTLRQKKISEGRKSLYLDFYPSIPHPKTGKPTRREFLGKYILENPRSIFDKKNNTEILLIAEQIRAKRENELYKEEIYTVDEKERLKSLELGEQNFVQYFENLKEKRSGSNYGNWGSAYQYLVAFTGGELKFKDIDTIVFENFKDYLLKAKSIKSEKAKLSRNSAVSYFNKIKATLKQAFIEGYLKTDINSKVPSIKAEETRRNYLTLEELNVLIKTPCRNKQMKTVALFSALTGLRFSDIKKLTWGEIEKVEGVGYFLNFIQKKTKGVEIHPISEQAYNLLGKRKERDQVVFEGLKYSAYNNKDLYNWIENAGITKEITFHCFRHTYATLQLFNGTDLYTVSKMLGHKDLKTTQIYAKIVDDTKRETVNKINLNFEENEY